MKAFIISSIILTASFSIAQTSYEQRAYNERFFTIDTNHDITKIPKDRLKAILPSLKAIAIWKDFMEGNRYVDDVCRILIKYPYHREYYSIETYKIRIYLNNIDNLKRLVAESILEYLFKSHELDRSIVNPSAIEMLKREFEHLIKPNLDQRNGDNYVLDPRKFEREFKLALQKVRTKYPY